MDKIKFTKAEKKKVQQVKPEIVRFSQTNIALNETIKVYKSMNERGWVDERNESYDPIDIVKMPDGKLTSFDNKRLFCAKILQVQLRARVHNFNDFACQSVNKRLKKKAIFW